MKYSGPPTCRRKETWQVAPFCDGCGVFVGEYRVWRANARFCSPDCRPGWHLVPGRECRGCGAAVLMGTGRGRPRSYCSDVCRRDAEAEDQRRRRAGEMTRAQEARFLELIYGFGTVPVGDPWLGVDGDPGFGIERRYSVKVPGRVTGLRGWLVAGGDWPGMVPGESDPVKDVVVLGSWEPWNQVA